MSVNLSIKDVSDELAAKLRARAARNHRSLQRELLAIIERAAQDEHQPAAPGDVVTRLGPGRQRGYKTMEQIAAEHLARYPEPITGGPSSVDIIRELRDSR